MGVTADVLVNKGRTHARGCIQQATPDATRVSNHRTVYWRRVSGDAWARTSIGHMSLSVCSSCRVSDLVRISFPHILRIMQNISSEPSPVPLPQFTGPA